LANNRARMISSAIARLLPYIAQLQHY
jgi:hypothetical protein